MSVKLLLNGGQRYLSESFINEFPVPQVLDLHSVWLLVVNTIFTPFSTTNILNQGDIIIATLDMSQNVYKINAH